MKQNKLLNNAKKANPYVLKFQLVIDSDNLKMKEIIFACLKMHGHRIEAAMYKEADIIMDEIKQKRDKFILNPKSLKEDQIIAHTNSKADKGGFISKVKKFIAKENRVDDHITTDMSKGERK